MSAARALLPAVLILLALPALRAAEGDAAKAMWYEKLDDAVAASAKSGKPILADFSGSDWCHWCQVLKKEVFDTPEFATWAEKTVVLLEVDMPMATAQAPEIAKQNEALCAKFSIEQWPSVLILDAKLALIGRLGYVPGGPKAFTAAFNAAYTSQIAPAK